MKVAFVKQLLDVFGPWRSIEWRSSHPERLLEYWPGKASLWEMTCLLAADWYVIPQRLELDYTRDLLQKIPDIREIMNRYTSNVVAVEDIPIDRYDVIISLDTILAVPPNSRTLFAYFMNEHWDRLSRVSLDAPIGNYDLFLSHMMEARREVSLLPQAVSFPYMRAPDVMRSVFDTEKSEKVWVDWRTLTTLSMSQLWGDAAEVAAGRLQERLRIPIVYHAVQMQRPYGVTDPPQWGDTATYIAKMAACRYYVGVGRQSGAGQGLCDAASLGCVCIGEADKVYHRLLCHPECLCEDMSELPERFGRVRSSRQLQSDVLEWQESRLRDLFVERPLGVLRTAIELKKASRFPQSRRPDNPFRA